MHRILIADPLNEAGLEILREAGADVHVLTDDERPNLKEMLAEFDALIVRSMTKVTAELLGATERLRIVGRAGIGVDNVDVVAATERGVLVVNAPTANLVSATEHTFALLLALARNVPLADASLKEGKWDRKGFVGAELQGKTLGVVGLGRIGQSVAARAQAFQMKVVAYDPFLDPSIARRLGIELYSVDELMERSDVVTLHTPLTDQTRNLLNAERIAMMKPGAILINCGRGGTVDEEALLAAIESGHLGGVGLDVYSTEPPEDFALIRHPKSVTTPHIGAQTREAQERVATETARMVLAALDGSLTVTAVNLPFSDTGVRGEPYLALGEMLGHLASSLHEGSIQSLRVDLWGVEETYRIPVSVAAVKGALTPFLGEAANYVNAEKVAADRGIEVVRATHQSEGDYPHSVGVSIAGDDGEPLEVVGTLFGENDPRVVSFAGYRLEFKPKGRLLFLQNRDVPGAFGRIGSLLGDEGINIADIHLARKGPGDAIAVLRVDEELSAEVMQKLSDLSDVTSAKLVQLD